MLFDIEYLAKVSDLLRTNECINYCYPQIGFKSTKYQSVILPDLPLIEYETFHKPFAEKYNIHVVFVISPETPIERIQLIDEKSSGFIYLVSSNSTTGNFKIKENQLSDSLKGITTLKLKNPILIGFGIKGAAEFNDACSISQGAIIGSSFVNLLSNSKDLKTDIPNFISNIKQNL